jgi:chemotaxis protein MotB
MLAKALQQMSHDAGLKSNLESVITPYGLRVMLHDTDKQGMFVRGSAIPTGKFQSLLRKMGPLFARMKNQMLIVGHTDSLQYENTSHAAFSNWNLSSNRAMSARAQLLAGSMPSDSVLQVVGMADRAPLDTKHATAGINRRIELLILTSSQANAVAGMFGMPGNTEAIAPGVETELPDAGELKQLRDKMLPAGG